MLYVATVRDYIAVVGGLVIPIIVKITGPGAYTYENRPSHP